MLLRDDKTLIKTCKHTSECELIYTDASSRMKCAGVHPHSTVMSADLRDAAQCPLAVRGAQRHVCATQTDGRPHRDRRQERGRPLARLNAVTLMRTHNMLQS